MPNQRHFEAAMRILTTAIMYSTKSTSSSFRMYPTETNMNDRNPKGLIFYENTSNYPEKRTRTEVTCYACDEPGHFMRNFPLKEEIQKLKHRKQENTDKRFVCTMPEEEMRTSNQIVVDTGAAKGTMSLKKAKRLELTIEKTDEGNLMSASGHLLRTVGKAVMKIRTWSNEGKKIVLEIETLVIDHDECPSTVGVNNLLINSDFS
eukprot:Platyproteum_vivax@DN12128_c0_g1_i1.p1